MRYVVDVDGTICTQEKDYSTAKPFLYNISIINSLYDAGHEIIFFTARGSETGIDWRQVTEEQLSRWNVQYHKLILGKPAGDVYIDDRAISKVYDAI